MNPYERDIERLKHIVNAIDDIVAIAADGLLDKKSYYSIIYLIQIVGEAANKISPETKAIEPEIEWKDIVSMRNFIAHEYDKIDLRIIEDTLKYDIPALEKKIKNLLETLQK